MLNDVRYTKKAYFCKLFSLLSVLLSVSVQSRCHNQTCNLLNCALE